MLKILFLLILCTITTSFNNKIANKFATVVGTGLLFVNPITVIARQGGGGKIVASDYQAALQGEIPLSSKPRAIKHRAFATCKNPEMLKLIQSSSSSFTDLSQKDCLQKVLSDDITTQVIQAIKDLPNAQLMRLNKKYGDAP